MRTTLTLDDDVAVLLKKFSQESGLSFREAVNQSIRRGLLLSELDEVSELPRPRPMGKPTVDLNAAIALLDRTSDIELTESFGATHDRS